MNIVRSALVALFVLLFGTDQIKAQQDQNVRWSDTLVKYKQTPPNISITGFGKALNTSGIPDTIRVDMLLALVNDYAQTGRVDTAAVIAGHVNRLAVEMNDTGRIGRSYLAMAWTHRDKGNIETVLEYTLKAEEMIERTDDKRALSMVYNTLASVYYDLKNDSLQKHYLEASYNLEKERGLGPGSATVISNLGYIYLKENRIDEAIEMFRNSLDVTRNIDRNYRSLNICYGNLIDALEIKGNYDQCVVYCDSLINMLGELDWEDEFIHMQVKRSYFLSLSGIDVQPDRWLRKFNAIDESGYGIDYRKLLHYDKFRFNKYFGNYKAALANFEEFKAFEDSLVSGDLLDQIAFYKEQFDAEKRENTIHQLEADKEISDLESEKQQARITYLIIGLALMVIFLFILITLYSRLNKAKAELENTNAIKDKFFAIIAHDLKSPMIALQGTGQKLDYYIRKGKTEKLAQIGGKIDHSITQLNHLLNNLLNWAISQSGSIPHHPAEISSHKLITENLELYRSLIESKGIEVETDLSTGSVYSDPNAFSAALRNLISNAVKFTRTEGTIRITSKNDGDYAEIRITDQGEGMGRDKIDELLTENVKSTPGTRGEKGFGLGLKISREFVTLNRGKLDIESTPGQGTTVVLRMPRSSN